MPIHDYLCDECNNIDEVFFTKSSDVSDTVECTKCGADTRRILSSSAFILKGEGWAKDGYTYRNKHLLEKYNDD